MEGKINVHKLESKVLRNNILGDPHIRDVIVYVPSGYSSSKTSEYPTIFVLPSFGNNAHSTLKRDPFVPTIFERLENLIKMKKCGEMIIIVIDCFNKFGGSQYINSDAIGKYKDHIIQELVPFVDNKYNIGKKALLGKSSGGFGALTIGMQHPDVFEAIAAHSFDSAFEYCYLQDFPVAFKTLRGHGSIKKWLMNFWHKENKQERQDFTTLNIVSMAAHYSPNLNNPDLNIDLPFDINTGEFRENIWNRWKEFDPINSIEKYKYNLKKIDLLYIDCGIADEFNLYIGNRIFSEKCKKYNINHDYEEYDGGHFGSSHRFNNSLEKIYNNFT